MIKLESKIKEVKLDNCIFYDHNTTDGSKRFIMQMNHWQVNLNNLTLFVANGRIDVTGELPSKHKELISGGYHIIDRIKPNTWHYHGAKIVNSRLIVPVGNHGYVQSNELTDQTIFEIKAMLGGLIVGR